MVKARSRDTPVFPLYVLERDDHSFREARNYGDLSRYEKIDIVDEDLYEGWDSLGRHFRFVWDESERVPVPLIDRGADWGSFRAAADTYYEMYIGRNFPGLCDPQALKAFTHSVSSG